MFENSNVIITAWVGDALVGVARTLSDFCWCSYLADLVVRQDIKAKGIGKKLIELTKEKVGTLSMILLLSVPGAMEYYPKVGSQRTSNGFLINRSE
jgi:predicted N-acetyltransferase YhbS